ncbi:MAG: 50S ribosomal protein L15 [Firmicutes bacterium]|nr:50S ribosomal protein L15 [Bacillota bacterium]
MIINELSGNLNARKYPKRLGRGIGSGKGKTAGKGAKGQLARSGNGKLSAQFEGGQVPLTRRLPKIGFTNSFKKEYNCINVGDLAEFKAGTVVDAALLMKKGFYSKAAPYGLKLLGAGEVKVALTVKCNKATEGAIKAIKKAGGKVEII